MTCNSRTYITPSIHASCEQDAGHDGLHAGTVRGLPYRWDDNGDRDREWERNHPTRQVDAYGRPKAKRL